MALLSKTWTIIILIACIANVFGDQGGKCRSALQAIGSMNFFSSVTNEDVYEVPKKVSPSGGVCKLAESCCSSNAERLLRRNVVQNLQKTLHDRLKIFNSCNATNLLNSLTHHIITWRNTTIELLNTYFHPFENFGILDTFTDYMIEGMRSLHLPNLEEHIAEMFFAVYHYSFKISIMPNTTNLTFGNCLREKFFTQAIETNIRHHSALLQERMGLLFQFVSSLRTGDKVIESISSQVLSSECGDALLRLTHCEACSGTTAALPPCAPFCQNVLRGCLVDLTEVGDAMSEYATALEAMRKRLDHDDNPWQAMTNIYDVLVLASKNGREAAQNWTTMSKACSTVNNSRNTRHQMKRSVTEFERFFPQMLSTTLDIAVSCVNNVSKLIQNLPDEFCQSITKRNHTCWNGKSIGSYLKPVQFSNRPSQLKNSEFELLSQSSVYEEVLTQLHSISMKLTLCADRTRSECNIELPPNVTPSISTSSHSFLPPRTTIKTHIIKPTNSVQSNGGLGANIMASIPIASVFVVIMALLLFCHIYHKLCRQKKKTNGIYDKIPIAKKSGLLPLQAPPKLPPPRISLRANPAYFHFDPEDAAKIVLNDCAAYEATVSMTSDSQNNNSITANSCATLSTLVSTPSSDTNMCIVPGSRSLGKSATLSQSSPMMETAFGRSSEYDRNFSSSKNIKSCQRPPLSSEIHVNVHHGFYCLQSNPDLCKCSCTIDYLNTQAKETTV